MQSEDFQQKVTSYRFSNNWPTELRLLGNLEKKMVWENYEVRCPGQIWRNWPAQVIQVIGLSCDWSVREKALP